MPINQASSLPYKIAVLVYAYDEQGRLLLMHRAKDPNQGLASPPGGKLETAIGESPAACAVREVHEEMGWDIKVTDLKLMGMVSETAFAGKNHWLMFLYRMTAPGPVKKMVFDEGEFIWHPAKEVHDLLLPDTDREVIYPLIEKYGKGFFAVHINCDEDGIVDWQLEEAIEG